MERQGFIFSTKFEKLFLANLERHIIITLHF